MAMIDQVRDAMHSVPFVPFTVRLVDGRSFTVRHPDFISVPSHPRGRSVVIHEDRRVNHIDIVAYSSGPFFPFRLKQTHVAAGRTIPSSISSPATARALRAGAGE